MEDVDAPGTDTIETSPDLDLSRRTGAPAASTWVPPDTAALTRDPAPQAAASPPVPDDADGVERAASSEGRPAGTDGARPGRVDPDAGRGTLPLAVELASYAAVAAIALGLAGLAGAAGPALGTGGKAGLAGLVALVGLSAGVGVMAIGDRGSRRLGGFLGALGTLGAAAAAGVVTDGALASSTGPSGTPLAHATVAGASWLAGGATCLVVGAALWRNRPLPMQLCTVVAGAMAAVVGAFRMVGLHPAPGVEAGVMWVAAMVLAGLAASGRLRPGTTAAVLAAAGAVAAGRSAAETHLVVGLTLGMGGVAVAAGALAVLHGPARRTVRATTADVARHGTGAPAR